MSKQQVRTLACVAAAALAAGLFICSLKLPVWHLKMEAPQYQKDEALRVRVYPGHLAGDLREIRVLNQYIGVHSPDQLPQTRWLPIALLAAAGLGLCGSLAPRAFRSKTLLGTAALLSLMMLGSAALAQKQMHQIGRNRDQHTVLRGIQDFTPPLLGSVKVANFEITAGLGTGALIIAGGIALQFGAALLSRRPKPAESRSINPAVMPARRQPATVAAL